LLGVLLLGSSAKELVAMKREILKIAGVVSLAALFMVWLLSGGSHGASRGRCEELANGGARRGVGTLGYERSTSRARRDRATANAFNEMTGTLTAQKEKAGADGARRALARTGPAARP